MLRTPQEPETYFLGSGIAMNTDELRYRSEELTGASQLFLNRTRFISHHVARVRRRFPLEQ
jgi:hypothetical protein